VQSCVAGAIAIAIAVATAVASLFFYKDKSWKSLENRFNLGVLRRSWVQSRALPTASQGRNMIRYRLWVCFYNTWPPLG